MAIQEIYILHHTHVDVGYTDTQPVVADQHVQYIDLALDYCGQTDDYPEDARFRWINEFSWPVVRFLEERPGREEELFERLRQGRMELCGLFLDPTELYDRRSLEEALRPALELAARGEFDLTTVMTTDIPGQGWSLADIIVEEGLAYLSVSPNSMVSKPVEVERPFYWIGPDGGRVLVWLTDWRNGWYGEGHVLGFPQGLEVARENVTQYVKLIESEGYPWHALALHMAADNQPPFEGLSDLVTAWNEEADLPRMRIATNREFFERMVQLHGDEFPSHRAAWPDWWSEGLGSAAYETGLSRETHAILHRIEALQAHLGDGVDLWPIFEDLLFFDEHTWGCQSMALNPHSFMSRATWTHKSAHIYRAYDAARRLEAELGAALAPAADAEDAQKLDYRDATLHSAEPGATRVTVCNPLTDEYHGPVALAGFGADVNELSGAEKPPTPVQHSQATALAEPGAWAVLSVAPGDVQHLWSRAARSDSAAGVETADLSVQNEFYRLCFSQEGRVTSLVDLQTDNELLDTRAPWGFAETIHESISGDTDRDAVWEKGYTEIPYGKRRTDAPFHRVGALKTGGVVAVEKGPVFESFTRHSELPFVRCLEAEIRLFKGLKRIDVCIRLDKQACEAYESLYVAFPFDLREPRGFVHSCGAVFEAEREQLPGTCRDYYAVEHFAALQGRERWAALCPVQAPLVQLGEITFGRWADQLRINRGCMYSWLTNNFWYTNFPGYQLGRLESSFALTTGTGELDVAAAEALGRANRVGLVVS